MRRLAPILGLLSLLPFSPLAHAQVSQTSGEGWISIVEPQEWRGEGSRGLAVFKRRSVRIQGIAFHPSGIEQVLINGDRTATTNLPNGQVQFVGYVPVREDTEEVEIIAYSQGPPIIRSFFVQADLTEKLYEIPENAWDEATGGVEGRRLAVIIGISQFADTRITPLKYAHADALAFNDFLRSDAAGLGGFKEEDIRLLLDEDATYRQIRSALSQFLRGVTEKDMVLLYFAGHGAPDPFRLQDHYLLTHDTDIGDIAGTGFPMSDVAEAVRRLRARDIIVITDACHAAAVSTDVTYRSTSPEFNSINQVFIDRLNASAGGLVTFAGSEVGQLSMEHERWGGGHGVFTHYILEALKGGADEDGDRIVSLGEMLEWVREKVQVTTENQQIPDISSTLFDRGWPMAIVAAPEAAEEDPEPELPSAAVATPSTVNAQREESPPSSSALEPNQVLMQGLLFPGLGEFKTQRNGRGALVLAGAAAALAAGFLVESTTESCVIRPISGSCPSEYLIGVESSKPFLVPGIAIAAAVTVLGAIDAYRFAKGQRAIQSRSEIGLDLGNGRLRVLPPALVNRHRGWGVEMVRLRF
jgi:uncharacterized caspase-like protein